MSTEIRMSILLSIPIPVYHISGTKNNLDVTRKVCLPLTTASESDAAEASHASCCARVTRRPHRLGARYRRKNETGGRYIHPRSLISLGDVISTNCLDDYGERKSGLRDTTRAGDARRPQVVAGGGLSPTRSLSLISNLNHGLYTRYIKKDTTIFDVKHLDAGPKGGKLDHSNRLSALFQQTGDSDWANLDIVL
ncbi:hypothetical protein EVAR_10830_1 [Eumeta japonica]|uniref:Uncharacterized protein n=1 Tax=Eumeta variegata TaxID=151549 RepID=A0A4C1Y6T9_EUMVA|nr:hypothetical protein EVAR_10830_1 [Eumeta japonica]